MPGDATMTTSDPLAASTTAAHMRASVEGLIAGQGTAMLIGAVVVWAVILWLTAWVARLPPLWLTLAAGGAASRCACALLVRTLTSAAWPLQLLWCTGPLLLCMLRALHHDRPAACGDPPGPY